MTRKRVAGVLMGAALVLCFAAGSIAAGRRIPVKGTFAGQIQRIKLSETSWSVKVTGNVRIANVGLGTAEITYDKVDLAPAGDNLQPGSTDGTGVITLANGDKLFGTFRWLTSPTANPDVLAIVGTLTVTSGTGLFKDARGSGIAVGRGNVPTNAVSLSLDGFLEGVSLRRPGFGG